MAAHERLLEPSLFADGAGVANASAAGSTVRLAASFCEQDGRTEFPVRATCPVCDGAMTGVALAEHGVLGGFTSVLHAPPGAAVSVPYPVGVARFPEGVSVLGLLVDVPPEEAYVGMSIECVVVRVGEEHLTYGFRPRAADTRG